MPEHVEQYALDKLHSTIADPSVAQCTCVNLCFVTVLLVVCVVFFSGPMAYSQSSSAAASCAIPPPPPQLILGGGGFFFIFVGVGTLFLTFFPIFYFLWFFKKVFHIFFEEFM